MIIWPFTFMENAKHVAPPQLPQRPHRTKEQLGGRAMTAKQIARREQIEQLLERTKRALK